MTQSTGNAFHTMNAGQSLYLRNADAATGVATTKNSPIITLRGAYWNGSASTNLDYQILNTVSATSPTSRLQFQYQGGEILNISQTGQITSPTGSALNLGTGTSGTALSIASATNVATFSGTLVSSSTTGSNQFNTDVSILNGSAGHGNLVGPTTAGKDLRFRLGNSTGFFSWRDDAATEIASMSVAGVMSFKSTTDASALGTASVVLSGGLSVAKKLIVGDVAAVGGATISTSTALITPAGTTGVSSLRIPHGSAPTSPVNGDMWTTTAGLFVRINGVTVGPLS